MSSKDGQSDFIKIVQNLLGENAGGEGILKPLLSLQKGINAFVLSSFPNRMKTDIIKNIWKILLKTAASNLSQVRLLSYQVTGTFLIRITPFYPQIVFSTFNSVLIESTIDFSSSAVIAASFAFLTNHLSRPYIQSFLQSSPVFHHFSLSDPVFSEYLPSIISGLGHVGIDWLKMLLHTLLEQVGDSTGRYLYRAIMAVIERAPVPLFNDLLSSITNTATFSSHLSLLSFLLGSTCSSLEGLELFQCAKFSVQLLNTSFASITDIDNCFQLLSAKTDAFSISISLAEPNSIKISVSDSDLLKIDPSDTNLSAVILIDKVKERPSFYLLPLPIPLLRPNEGDTPLILSSKLKTLGSIASNATFPISDVTDVFLDFVFRPYGDPVSSALQGLSLCINRFIPLTSDSYIDYSIRKILFSTTSSWFHSYDILKIIREIDPKLLLSTMGEGAYNEAIRVMLGFCFSSNERLSDEASTAIIKFIYPFNYDEIADKIVKSMDPFDKIQRSLRLIEKLMIKFIPRTTTGIRIFAAEVAEAELYHIDNLETLAQIFTFLSHFSFSKCETFTPIVEHCLAIVKISIEYLAGEEWNVKISPDVEMHFKQVVTEYIKSKSTDIVTLPISEILKWSDPIRSALKFIFSQPQHMIGSQLMASICKHCFRLFPKEVSIFYKEKWSMIPDSDKYPFMFGISPIIYYNDDESIHACWCSICSKFDLRHPSMSNLVNIFGLLVASYLRGGEIKEEANAFDLIVFVTSLSSNSAFDVSNFLRKSEPMFRLKVIKRLSVMAPYNIQIIRNFDPDLFLEFDSVPSAEEIDAEFPLPAKMTPQMAISLEPPIVMEKFDIESIVIPPNSVSSVAKWMITNQPNYFSIEVAFGHLLDGFRKLALIPIEKDPGAIVKYLAEKERVTKTDMQALCSIVGVVKFNLPSLLLLSYKILGDSKSLKRLTCAIQLLASIILLLPEITSDIISQIISALSSKYESLPQLMTSICLLVLSIKTELTPEAIQLVNNCLSKDISTPFSNYCQILLRIQTVYVDQQKITELSDAVQSFLSSGFASLRLAGINILNQSILSLPADLASLVLQKNLPTILSFYTSITNNYPMIEAVTLFFANAIKGFQFNSKIYATVFNQTAFTFSDFAFHMKLRLISEFIKVEGHNKEFIDKERELVAQIMLRTLNLPTFSAAVRSVEELARLSNYLPDQGKTLVDFIVIWLQNESTRYSYMATEEIDIWLTLMEKYLQPQHIISILCFQFMKYVPAFFTVFMAIWKFYSKKRDDNEIRDILGAAPLSLKDENHANSLKMLLEGGLTKEAIDLALK